MFLQRLSHRFLRTSAVRLSLATAFCAALKKSHKLKNCLSNCYCSRHSKCFGHLPRGRKGFSGSMEQARHFQVRQMQLLDKNQTIKRWVELKTRILLLCVFLHVCAGLCVSCMCLFGCICLGAFVWRPENEPGCCSSGETLSLAWILPNRLDYVIC